MKRVSIVLDNDLYEILRDQASREKKSIAGMIREIVRKDILQSDRHRSSSVKNLTFISIGRSNQAPLKPVSERHDEALEEVFQK
jgi:metal-responsive CopG/Arc/MetJ family transcriptional regulator